MKDELIDAADDPAIAPERIMLSNGANALVPDACHETRRAAVDLIRGDPPTTVLGLLMSRDEPLTVEAIAGLLGRAVEEVDWTVDVLVRDELCARLAQDDGLEKILAFAPYTMRNEDFSR